MANIPFEVFKARISDIESEEEFVSINLDNSQYLWIKMSSGQKAKVMPYGYLRNYIRIHKVKISLKVDIIELLQSCIDGNLNFGIPKRIN